MKSANIAIDVLKMESEGIKAIKEGLLLAEKAADNSNIPDTVGILVEFGAKGMITQNKVSGNICNFPECGPDFFTDIQAFGIAVTCADKGSVISNN